MTASGSRLIEGTVTSPHGEPLIGANVIVPGTTLGAVTDFDGNFRLEIPESTEQLQVAYTGFTTESISLKPDDSTLNVVMDDQDAVLDEVVVTGYKTRRTQNATAAQSQSAPYPRGGFDKMKSYLKKNLQYPEEARSNGVEGSVLLEFTVNQRGKPEAIRVIRSLGRGCDQEAIRLLEKGPRWQNITPGVTTRYTILFSLND